MTISSENRKAGPFLGTGSQTAFPFTFAVFTPADVMAVLTDTTPADAALVLGSDYSVALNPDQSSAPGGTVTLSQALAAGWRLTLTSAVDNLQPLDLTNLGAFYPRTIMRALDRTTVQIQQLAERVKRALKTSISVDGNQDITLPPASAGALVGWNDQATQLTNFSPALLGPNGALGLRAELLDATSAAKGAGLLAYGRTLSYPVGSVGLKLKDTVSATEFGMSVLASAAANKAALISALAAADSVLIPAGTFSIDGPIDVTNKRIRGDGIYRTILQVPGSNTPTTLFHNGKTSSAAWGSGGSLELRDLSLRGSWDGSAALADQSWDNTPALVKLGAAAGLRVVDVEVFASYGHGISCYRLGYANFTRVKDRTNRKCGLHLEAPNGSDAITSTWITNCDFNSNRGVGSIYIKNGVGVFILGNVFEDGVAGQAAIILDGNDNRAVSISHNHCETYPLGLLKFIGAGLKTSVCHNFCDAPITRTAPENQLIYAVGNVGTPNVIEDGLGTLLQPMEAGDGTAFNNPNNRFGFYGTAGLGDVLGTVRWRSNNNFDAGISSAEIRAVARGNVNQNFGALEFGTGNNGHIYRFRLDENGHFYPLADQAYALGRANNGRLLNIFSQNVVLSPPSSVTPTNNGEVTFQLTSNTSLTIKVRGSDGVVRSGSIALA